MASEDEIRAVHSALKAAGATLPVLWCPECDGKQPHRVHGYVAECTVCHEPHEINPVTLQPI